MKTPILLLILAAGLVCAAEGDNQPNPEGQPQRRRTQPEQNQDGGQGNFRPEGGNARGNMQPMKPALTPDEMKKVHAAFEKVRENPAVKEAHEAAAEAQKAAGEAMKKAREITEAAAIQADPEVAPLLEKMKKAGMHNRQPQQPQNFRQPGDGQPNNNAEGNGRRNRRQPDGEPQSQN